MKPYPAYKESGVEWLGPVPEGWEVMPLKRRFSVRLGKMLQPVSRAPEDFEAPYLRAANIQWSGVDLSDVKTMWFNPAEAAALNLNPGDLLVSEGGDVGRSAIVNFELHELYFQNSVNRVRTRAQDSTRFLYYWMCVIKALGYVDVLCNKSTIAHFTAEKVEAVPVPLPPLPEQQAIAAFLDRETAKIDGLIEEQRRLIALLAEKRQATISHAVTRGLNPFARLKPSGVDWLGDVPEGWEVVPLKRIATIGNGSTPNRDNSTYWQDGHYPWLNSSVVNSMEITSAEQFVTDAALKECHLPLVQAPAVLVGITGQGKTRGLVGILRFEATINQHLAFIRPKNKRVNCEFVAWLFRAAYEHVRADSEAGSTKGAITCDYLSNFKIPLPPWGEVTGICSYLDSICAVMEALTETATSTIALLQERRAALISAAVTGKIDVRDMQASPSQARRLLSVSVLLGGVIIAALGRHASMGRMLVQKHLFMAEAHAGVSELQGRYDRQAAGPYDAALQRRVEDDLVAAGLLRVAQDGGPGSRVEYEFLGDAAALRADLAVALGDRMARFDDTFRQLADLAKPGIEAVATLYAAWNDFLMDGKDPKRGDIIREVLENWHPEKRKKFTKADLSIWLDWMERHEILPTGTGPKTQTGRLFP